jgi:hypothetical protein
MMKPSELFDLAREVYRYINVNPLVSRGILNSQFRTSSDDRRNRQLTEAIDALLARLYVYKYTDEGTTQTFFWTQEFKDSPYEPDDEPILDYTPVDAFGGRPVDEEPAPSPQVKEPEPTPESAPPAERPALDENSPEYKAMQKMYERIGGKLKRVYEVMMTDPTKIWGKADAEFSFLGDHVQRAMMLGRMFGLGYIRRFKDTADKTVSYYTIFGQCPTTLVEDNVELGKAAQKRQKAAQEALDRQNLIDRVKEGLQQRQEGEKVDEPETPKEDYSVDAKEEVVEEPIEETEEFEDETINPTENEDDEVIEDQEPEAYMSNLGRIFIRRKDNSAVDLDEDESMAVIEMLGMLNPIVLQTRLDAYKRKKEQE